MLTDPRKQTHKTKDDKPKRLLFLVYLELEDEAGHGRGRPDGARSVGGAARSDAVRIIWLDKKNLVGHSQNRLVGGKDMRGLGQDEGSVARILVEGKGGSKDKE